MTKRSWLVCAWLGAAVLAAGDRAAAQCTPPSGETGFNDVIFSSTSTSFNQVLPFDVPLRVCADVPDGTLRASVKYAAARRRSGPLDVDAETCTIRTPGVQWSQEYERVPTGNTVRWVIGRLEAERYYVFCFQFEKKATDADIATFRTAARTALDQALAPVRSATLTAEQTQALCLDLRQRLLDVTRVDQILTPGTIFDCDATQVAVFATKVSRGPLEAQLNAQRILAGVPNDDPLFTVPSLGQRQSELQAMLSALQADPVLAKLLDAVGRQAALEPTVAAKVQSLCPNCSALVGPAATPAERLALGEDAASMPGAAITVSSDGAQTATMAQGYLALAKNLGDLAALVSWAIGPDAPAAVAAELTDADRAALATLVREGGPLQQASRRASGLASTTQLLSSHLASRSKGIDALADELSISARSLLLGDASTLGNFTTAQKNYISLDAGLTWAVELEEVVPYAGTNIYFRPVNRNAPLRSLGNFRQTFSRRFALTLGLTASSIADQGGASGTQQDLFGNQSLLLGAGIRVTDAMRLGAGAIVFKQDDPNPLVDESRLNTSYYLSLSFDIDVVRMFSKPLQTALGVTDSP